MCGGGGGGYLTIQGKVAYQSPRQRFLSLLPTLSLVVGSSSPRTATCSEEEKDCSQRRWGTEGRRQHGENGSATED